MSRTKEAAEKRIAELVADARHIVVIQADNPDGDSMGSALALEQILGEMGKQVSLYCAVDVPEYIKYLEGWDRIRSELPNKFDLSIIVDASTMTLLEKLSASGQAGWAAAKPCIVLDHHAETASDIPFVTVGINDPAASSTGEVIYRLSKNLLWPIDAVSGACIMAALLGDTQGLTNELATPYTYHVMAELMELGVSRPQLEELRREFSKMEPVIYAYKGRLIERTEFFHEGSIAFVSIPHSEIKEYSPLYNPAPLIQGDMLQVASVKAAIVMKLYDDGKILCAIRCNQGSPIAAELAVGFGGGGHPYASGFKITDGRSFEDVKSACLSQAARLIDKLGAAS